MPLRRLQEPDVSGHVPRIAVSLRSPWRRPAAWPRRPVARAPSRKESGACGDEELCGDIVWLKEPFDDDDSEKRDILNEDESLRGRLVIGLQMLTGLSDGGDGEWEDGEIYNVKDGKTYDVEIELVDANTLNVSVCVFVFCQTEAWTRVE